MNFLRNLIRRNPCVDCTQSVQCPSNCIEKPKTSNIKVKKSFHEDSSRLVACFDYSDDPIERPECCTNSCEDWKKLSKQVQEEILDFLSKKRSCKPKKSSGVCDTSTDCDSLCPNRRKGCNDDTCDVINGGNNKKKKSGGILDGNLEETCSCEGDSDKIGGKGRIIPCDDYTCPYGEFRNKKRSTNMESVSKINEFKKEGICVLCTLERSECETDCNCDVVALTCKDCGFLRKDCKENCDCPNAPPPFDITKADCLIDEENPKKNSEIKEICSKCGLIKGKNCICAGPSKGGICVLCTLERSECATDCNCDLVALTCKDCGYLRKDCKENCDCPNAPPPFDITKADCLIDEEKHSEIKEICLKCGMIKGEEDCDCTQKQKHISISESKKSGSKDLKKVSASKPPEDYECDYCGLKKFSQCPKNCNCDDSDGDFISAISEESCKSCKRRKEDCHVSCAEISTKKSSHFKCKGENDPSTQKVLNKISSQKTNPECDYCGLKKFSECPKNCNCDDFDDLSFESCKSCNRKKENCHVSCKESASSAKIKKSSHYSCKGEKNIKIAEKISSEKDYECDYCGLKKFSQCPKNCNCDDSDDYLSGISEESCKSCKRRKEDCHISCKESISSSRKEASVKKSSKHFKCKGENIKEIKSPVVLKISSELECAYCGLKKNTQCPKNCNCDDFDEVCDCTGDDKPICLSCKRETDKCKVSCKELTKKDSKLKEKKNEICAYCGLDKATECKINCKCDSRKCRDCKRKRKKCILECKGSGSIGGKKKCQGEKEKDDEDGENCGSNCPKD